MGRLPQWGLLAAGLAVSAAIAAVVGWGRLRPEEVPRPARWVDTLVICPTFDVRRPELDEAMAWWRKLGHDVEVSCAQLWGASIDIDPTLEGFGTTHVWAEGELMLAAEVLIRPDVGSLGIAHELGHALGYRHPRAAPSGHMLHPSRPGWDARGLEGP